MYQRVLLALDLEGVNKVIGEPYMGLEKDSEQWKIACAQAVLEVNAAATALFEAGVRRVGLWDNHGGYSNVDPAALDPRIELLAPRREDPRMSFIHGEFDCICYFGYHAMEGTLSGVLAHTMSSKDFQFFKLNGSYIGEVDMDAYIAASHGVPSRFYAGGDIACRQAVRAVPDIVTVTTKKELGRNLAEFRDNEELFADIKREIVRAVSETGEVRPLAFPAIVEKSFKRTETAERYLRRWKERGLEVAYLPDEILGFDAHTLVITVHNIEEFILCL